MFSWNRGVVAAIVACSIMAGCSKDDNNTSAPPSTPTAPTGLHVVGTARTSIQLAWTDNATDEDTYYVERSALDNQSFHRVGTLGANVVAFTDTGLVNASRYYYRVCAAHGTAFSGYSNEVSAVAVANDPPNTPTVVFPTNNSTGLVVSPLLRWSATDPDSDTLTYDVYFGTAANPPLDASGLTQASLQKSNLDTSTTYYWRVVAKDTYAETSGPVWSFTTASIDAWINVTAPDGGEMVVSDTIYTVHWTSHGLDGGVDILLSKDGGNNWPYTVVTNATNTGSYSWLPQTLGVLGDSCRLKIRRHTVQTVLDVSDGNFTIYLPWAPQVSGVSVRLQDLAFVGTNRGWVVGDGGTILHTTNGGSTWAAQNSGTGFDFYGVSFTDGNNGWAVGQHGQILHTTDGIAWNAQTSVTVQDLSDVTFVTPLIGWAVGTNGTVLRTSNGGNGANGWSVQVSGIGEWLLDVAFVDTSNGWTVGANGTILHTSSGGALWATQTSGTNNLLYRVCFVDVLHGWTVGYNGTILYTTNGGATWAAQQSGVSDFLSAVYFTDVNHGWVIGDNGRILRTTNGGITWIPEGSRTAVPLRDLTFTDNNHGWAVGDNGTIMHTNTGGQ
jgi:photosystem II stability/assembly factor-like uncharacterized protein